MTDAPSRPRPKAREINDTIRYTMWSVFKVAELPADRTDLVAEVDDLVAQLEGKGVVVRGWYDVAGLRAEADFMVWWHASDSDLLQEAYHSLRQTKFGHYLTPVWSQLGMHRPAEFNKGHVPAFMAEEEARPYLCLYPFVRSFEWYLLPEGERRAMLAEHGMMGREYPDVRANTVAAFALGDYEWLLAFEADELDRLVDVMRHLRGSQARLHVREETPFYTGRRRQFNELVATLA